ncbi:MAG: formamidopyrimidine DNA glycosylase [Candidatus Dormibacteraeota bacterium]|nr:formamidopyrimidine DNA glycosylase [Candidatus Dormibacteraeota bacterium]
MPEGDTIWRVAAALRARILGAVVTHSSHTGLEDRRIERIDAVGKHLIIRFEGGWAVRTHLGMWGSWWVFRPRERWSLPAWQARLVLETQDWVAVCFLAPTVEVTQQPEQALRGLGPDLLAPDLDLDTVVRRARAVGGETPLGELLLDQRVAAGIGNVYRCEILWSKRRSPWQAAEELDDAGLRDLYAYAVDALRLNLHGQGYGRRFPDHARRAVHSRGGRPCPRCGTRIQVRRQGALARFTYFCPSCQPDPK